METTIIGIKKGEYFVGPTAPTPIINDRSLIN
jgi:hypothetical protein